MTDRLDSAKQCLPLLQSLLKDRKLEIDSVNDVKALHALVGWLEELSCAQEEMEKPKDFGGDAHGQELYLGYLSHFTLPPPPKVRGVFMVRVTMPGRGSLHVQAACHFTMQCYMRPPAVVDVI